MKILLALNYTYENTRDASKTTHKLQTEFVIRDGLPTEQYLRDMCKSLANTAQEILDTSIPHEHFIVVSVAAVAVSQLSEEPITETEKEY